MKKMQINSFARYGPGGGDFSWNFQKFMDLIIGKISLFPETDFTKN